MARATAREHSIGRDTFHYKWDNSLPPAVEIEPGDVVHFDTEEVTSGQLKKGDDASKLGALFTSRAPNQAMSLRLTSWSSSQGHGAGPRFFRA